MQNTTVKNGQSIFDVSMQQAGTIEAAMALALANDLSITAKLSTGQVLQNVPVMNKQVVNIFFKEKRLPATDETAGQELLEGIGFWFIELDLKIS